MKRKQILALATANHKKTSQQEAGPAKKKAKHAEAAPSPHLTAIQRFAPDFRTLNLCHRYANGIFGVPNLQYLAARVCAQLAVKLNGRGSPMAWNAVALEGPMLTYLRWFVPRHKQLQLTAARVKIRFYSILGRGAQNRFGYLKWSLFLDEAAPEDNPNGIDVATWQIMGSPEGFHDFDFRTTTKSKANHPISPCLDRHDLIRATDNGPVLLPLPSYLFPMPEGTSPTLTTATPLSPGMLPAPKVRDLPFDAPLFAPVFLEYVFQRRYKAQNHVSTLDNMKDIVSRGVFTLHQQGKLQTTTRSRVLLPQYTNCKNCVENAVFWLYLRGHLDLDFIYDVNNPTDVGYDCVYRRVQAQPWKPTGVEDDDRPNKAVYATIRANFGPLCNLVHRSIGDLSSSPVDPGMEAIYYDDFSPPHTDDPNPDIVSSQSLFEAMPDYSPYCLEAVLHTLEYEGSVVHLYDLDDLGKWWARRF